MTSFRIDMIDRNMHVSRGDQLILQQRSRRLALYYSTPAYNANRAPQTMQTIEHIPNPVPQPTQNTFHLSGQETTAILARGYSVEHIPRRI